MTLGDKMVAAGIITQARLEGRVETPKPPKKKRTAQNCAVQPPRPTTTPVREDPGQLLCFMRLLAVGLLAS